MLKPTAETLYRINRTLSRGVGLANRYATQQNTIQIVPAKQEHARSYRLS
jgi:hypothetical protein